MGTNFYFHRRPCIHCGAKNAPLHIGKSSGGWCFGLHVIPEEGICDLDDWEAVWEKENGTIENEYGEIIEPEEMLQIIQIGRAHV